MAQQDPELPIEPSQPAPVLVTRRFDDFEAFSLAYAGRLSLSGLFVAAIEPLAVGSTVHVDFQLNDGFRLFHGVGEVVWVRPAALGPDLPSGMGVRFLALDEKGRELILKLLEDHVKSGGLPFELEPPPDGAVTTWAPRPEPEGAVSAETPSDSSAEVTSAPADPTDFAPPWQQEIPDIPSDLLAPDTDSDIAGAGAAGAALSDDRTVLVPPVPPVSDQAEISTGRSDLEPIPHRAADVDGDEEERGSDGLAEAVARLEPLPGGARADESQPISLEMESLDAALDFGLDPAEGWVQDAEAAPPEKAPAPATEAPNREAPTPPPDRTAPAVDTPPPSTEEPPRQDPAVAPLEVAAPEARAQSWLAEPEPAAAEPSPAPAAAPAAVEAEATPEAPARRSLLPLIALLALVAVAAAGWLTRERWLPLLADDTEVAPAPPPEAPVPPQSVGDGFGAGDGVNTPDAGAPTVSALGDPAVGGNSDGGGNDAGGDGSSDSRAVLEETADRIDDPIAAPSDSEAASTEPETAPATPPAAVSPPPSPVDAPARRLEDISWRETAEGTLVILEADGPLAAERLSWSQLGGANPRLLLRLRDIAEPYRANRLTVASAAVERIRTGFHPSPEGDELHVVLDLAGPGFALARAPDPRADGRIEILIAAP